MVPRIDTRQLLRPEDIPPSDDRFEVISVFNPGAVQTPDGVVLLVRVAERPRELRADFLGLPRWDPVLGVTIDWVPDADHDALDPRVVRRRADGIHRLTFISHLRVVRCGAGREVQEITPATFRPQNEMEEYGVEDPRITPIDGRYYFTYVSVSRHGAATALASTVDFQRFERHGIIFCPENKDVVVFPELIDGMYTALHRPVCGTPFIRPEIWVARSCDLLHWGEHVPLPLSCSDWRSGKVGAGTPPIRVAAGWLAIYHGNRQPSQPGEVGAYHGGAMLLDARDPSLVIGQAHAPILVPEQEFEVNGFVQNVVFPTGLVRDRESLLVYYGAADSSTAVVELSEREVLAAVGARSG
jgi:predicted GH43/DUF377 family glycosyl hydrolase